jgi:hypothetical protein
MQMTEQVSLTEGKEDVAARSAASQFECSDQIRLLDHEIKAILIDKLLIIGMAKEAVCSRKALDRNTRLF